MRQTRAILFDKDGTLFDFQATWAGVVLETLAALHPDPAVQHRLGAAVGFDVGSGRFVPGSPIVAGALDEVAALWLALCPEQSLAGIVAMIEAVGTRAARRPGLLVPAAPDLRGLMSGLAARGLWLGVATHDSAAAARAHLSEAGVLDLFAFVAGYDSGHGLKPGRGMLDAFCSATGVAPDHVAVVGDSVHDLGMARAGGALSVGVLTGPAGRGDLDPLADHVLGSIAELPALLDRLAG